MPEQEPVIHFASLFCVDYDVELFPHWLEHYNAFPLETKKIFLHSPSGDVDAIQQVREACRAHGWKTAQVKGTFRDGLLRKFVLEQHRKTLPPNHWLMVADSDEFQVWPSVQTVKDQLAGFDVILGELLDAFNTTLPASVDPDVPLHVQFPHLFAGIEKELFPKLGINYNKICAARAGIPVCFIGSHDVLANAKKTYRTRGTIPVHHFKWRKTVVDRLKGKTYYNKQMVEAVGDFFKGE